MGFASDYLNQLLEKENKMTAFGEASTGRAYAAEDTEAPKDHEEAPYQRDMSDLADLRNMYIDKIKDAIKEEEEWQRGLDRLRSHIRAMKTIVDGINGVVYTITGIDGSTYEGGPSQTPDVRSPEDAPIRTGMDVRDYR